MWVECGILLVMNVARVLCLVILGFATSTSRAPVCDNAHKGRAQKERTRTLYKGCDVQRAGGAPGGVIFLDEKTISPMDIGDLVRALI
jgi:hypothetical protein